jgi:hypothetical protein
VESSKDRVSGFSASIGPATTINPSIIAAIRVAAIEPPNLKHDEEILYSREV